MTRPNVHPLPPAMYGSLFHLSQRIGDTDDGRDVDWTPLVDLLCDMAGLLRTPEEILADGFATVSLNCRPWGANRAATVAEAHPDAIRLRTIPAPRTGQPIVVLWKTEDSLASQQDLPPGGPSEFDGGLCPGCEDCGPEDPDMDGDDRDYDRED